MDRGKKILHLMNEIENMPEKDLAIQMQSLGISIHIFNRNYQDLITFLNAMITDHNEADLDWSEHSNRLVIAMNVLCLLHNYVASAVSLLEHTRNHYKKFYTGTKKFTDYQEKVNNEFAKDPLANFVKDLRKYCQHYKSPNLDFMIFWEAGDEKPRKTINLLKENLILFDGWSSYSKKFLGDFEDQINLHEIVSSYWQKVMEFYQWFQRRQEEIHRVDLKRLRLREIELFRLTLEDDIDMNFAFSKAKIPHRKDHIFARLFTSAEFEEIENIGRNSPERPLRAIEILEKNYFTISEQIKERIIKLYDLPDIFPDFSEKEA